MSKKITLNVPGKDGKPDGTYLLEYTRKSVKIMETRGFVVDDVNKKMMTGITSLFAGAFLAHVKNTTINHEEIFFDLPNRGELVSQLVEMYNETLSTLVNSQEDAGNEGNAVWTVTE